MAQTSTHDLRYDGAEVRKRFVSWSDGEAEREWACLVLLAEHAPGLAPRPLRRETDDGAPVVVMERLPGRPLTPAPLDPGQGAALGRALRRLYAVPLDAVTAAGITERRFASTQADVVAGWLRDAPDLAPCRDPGLVQEAADAALAFLADDGARPTMRLTTLGIADLNPANVLWDGETCRLVDFEDAGLTERAYEVADHVEHLAARLPGLHDVDRLADAVGLDAEDRARMHGFRPQWAAFWLAMLLPGNGGWHRNPPGTTEDQARHLLALLGKEGRR